MSKRVKVKEDVARRRRVLSAKSVQLNDEQYPTIGILDLYDTLFVRELVMGLEPAYRDAVIEMPSHKEPLYSIGCLEDLIETGEPTRQMEDDAREILELCGKYDAAYFRIIKT